MGHPRHVKVRVDGDGVRIEHDADLRRLVWIASVAIGVPVLLTVVAVVAIRWMPGGRSDAAPLPRAQDGSGAAPPDEVRREEPPEKATSMAPVERNPDVRPRRIERGSPANPPKAATRAAAPAAAKRPEVDAGEAIMALRSEGIQEGIAVFPLPGTDPPKPGVIVPEDFDLPEGFVRHYQSTDAGERLPAILMVHPDYELVDARGQPVTVPDRIVPPELAPPGMPIRMLEISETKGASGAR